jgi:hypothetical protein
MNMPPHGSHPQGYPQHPQHPHQAQQQQSYGHPQAFAQGAAMQQSSHYEFGPAEDAEIGKTATWAKALGALGFVNAASQLLSTNIMGAIIAGAIGLLFFKGGTALANVVQTKGHDVHHVVSALDQFGQAFLARFIILVLTLVLALVAIPIILLVPAMLMSR